MNGKHEGAIRDARSALELDPSDPIAQASLILAYLRSGKFREAETQASKALVAAPANSHHYYARAIARKGLGNEAGAGEDLKTARQLQFDIILDPAFFGLRAN